MRITENSNFDQVRDTISRSREKMAGLQHQAATLKKMNQPSDDPVGAAKVLELRTDKANNDQYQMNAKLAQAFLDNSDHALGDLSEIVVRAKELALNQASSLNTSEEARMSVAEEVDQLYQQSVSIANRKIGERYLFGGYQTLKPPVDSHGDYHGDDGQIMVEIASDVFISANLPGSEVFNLAPKSLSLYSPTLSQHNEYSETTRRPADEAVASATSDSSVDESANLFLQLQNFRTSLVTGDLEGVRETLDQFDHIHSKLVALRAKVGARINGLESANRAIERHNLTNATLSSTIEDADMSQVVSDLGKEENVFKSALASSKRLIQPTLLDFLR